MYPALAVDMRLSDRVMDVLDEGFDVVVRVGKGPLPDSDLRSTCLARGSFWLCAAPSWVDAHPLDRPEDLLAAHFVAYGHRLGTPRTQEIELGPHRLEVRAGLRFDNGLAVRQAAVAGAGPAMLPRFLAEPEVEDGRLVRLFADLPTPTYDIYALRPSRTWTSPAVDAVVLGLRSVFADQA